MSSETIAESMKPKPNYSKSQIEERLLQGGAKQIPAKHLVRYTIILSIKKNLEIAEKEYA